MCLGLFFEKYNHITCIKILLGKLVSQCLHEESFEINVHNVEKYHECLLAPNSTD